MWKVISYIQIKSNQIQCKSVNITVFIVILHLDYIRKQKIDKIKTTKEYSEFYSHLFYGVYFPIAWVCIHECVSEHEYTRVLQNRRGDSVYPSW